MLKTLRSLLFLGMALAIVVLVPMSADAKHCRNGSRHQASLSPYAVNLARRDVRLKQARHMTGEHFNRADRRMYRAISNGNNCNRGWQAGNNRRWYTSAAKYKHGRNGRCVAAKHRRHWH